MPHPNQHKRRTDCLESPVRNKRCMDSRKANIMDDSIRSHCDDNDDDNGAPSVLSALISTGSGLLNTALSFFGPPPPPPSHTKRSKVASPKRSKRRPHNIGVDSPSFAAQIPLPPSPSSSLLPFQNLGPVNGARTSTSVRRHDSLAESLSMSYSGQTSPTSSRSPRRASSTVQTNGVSKYQPHRKHIRYKQHRALAKEQQRQELTQLKMNSGQSAAEIDELLGRAHANDVFSTSRTFSPLGLKPTSSQLSLSTSKQTEEELETMYSQHMLERAIKRARDALESARTPRADFSIFLEDLKSIYEPTKPSLPKSLSPEDQAEVAKALQKRGTVGKVGREQVSHTDLSRLGPAQWLNDEIINFYGALIMARSEEAKKDKAKALDVHYFNSFFFAKLEDPGYDKARLGKWTKKFDIFKKDVVLLPVNIGNMHWTCAAINFAKKRIEYYDSMGTNRGKIYKHLREYLNKEHLDKKKKPFDFTGWKDYFSDDAPQQDNAHDCGVFSCQFMEAISRGDEFGFTQANMNYLRERMILEITRGKLWDRE
ncbi:Ulp1 protease family, carboxy-terminal catalytic domain protein [Ceratobasidium sp. AG-Ba]|nr:Ulp1 protease family, carboxy-terminal catalytic domain protein [Ceratobasidium sp. AG-Ba]